MEKDNLIMQINPSKESNGGRQPFQHNRIYDTEGISPALSTDSRPPAILVPEATKKGYVEIQPGECFDAENINSSTRRGRKMVDKSNCLMAKTTDFMQYKGSYMVLGPGYEQDNRAYYEDGKSGTLDVHPGRQKVVIADKAPCLHVFEHGSNGQFNRQLVRKNIIRRLTPVECERLQTVPEGYTAHVSDTQRYRMLGNGWTVDVVAHIFKSYKNELILKQSGLW